MLFRSGFALVWSLSLWDRWWVWLSMAILAAIWLAMYRFGGAYYGLIEDTATRAIAARGTDDEGPTLAAFAAARLSWTPAALAAVGLGGIAAILWLMIFRPF